MPASYVALLCMASSKTYPTGAKDGGKSVSVEPGCGRSRLRSTAISCASGKPLLAAHATIGAWSKGGEPWHRRHGIWVESHTGDGSWRGGGVADFQCGPSAERRASASHRSTCGGGSLSRPTT